MVSTKFSIMTMLLNVICQKKYTHTHMLSLLNLSFNSNPFTFSKSKLKSESKTAVYISKVY